MEDNKIINLLTLAVKIGYAKVRIDSGDLKPYLSLTEAHAKFGRRIADSWITEENSKIIVIKGLSKNSKVKIDRLQLERRAAAPNFN